MAKCLKLVAPATMGAEQQMTWLAAAVDALADIRVSEVAAISAELRRKVTRPAQIVPEIAELVASHRRRPTHVGDAGTCACGQGEAARGGRADIHWVKRDGRTEIGWCADNRPAASLV